MERGIDKRSQPSSDPPSVETETNSSAMGSFAMIGTAIAYYRAILQELATLAPRGGNGQEERDRANDTIQVLNTDNPASVLATLGTHEPSVVLLFLMPLSQSLQELQVFSFLTRPA